MPQYDNHEQSQNVYSVQKTYKAHAVMTGDNPTPQNDDFVLKSSCLVTSEKGKSRSSFLLVNQKTKGLADALDDLVLEALMVRTVFQTDAGKPESLRTTDT